MSIDNYTNRRKFRKRTPTRPIQYPAQLGNGAGVVIVPNMLNHVYCRVAGRVDIVYNDAVSPQDNVWVNVGRDPVSGRYQVMDTRGYAPAGSTASLQVGYAPAKRYEWMAAGGGQDPLWVQGRQFMPLNIMGSSGMTVQLRPGTVYAGGVPVNVAYQTADLTAHIPAAAGNAALVLMTINTSGTLVATKGTEFVLATKTTPALMNAMTPAIPASTAYVCAVVRVYNGQTAISEARSNTDIEDMRFSGLNASLSSITNHASTHISTGTDPIAAAVAGGASGLMTGTDKTKLDGITAGARAITIAEVDGTPSGTPATLKMPNGSLTDNGDGSFTFAPAGTGDVVGPASATDGNMVVFDGTTGKLIKDGGAPGGDAAAIHDNVAAEISAVTEKTAPVSADLLLIEDSAASNAKKRVQIGNLVTVTDYSATSTLAGWSGTPTVAIYVEKIGRKVAVQFYISGTSNATSASFTLPYVAGTGLTFGAPIALGADNGTGLAAPSRVRLTAGSATVGCDKAANASNGWTASGTKTISGNFTYLTD